MFRALIKKRNNLDGNYIADIRILSGEISEDKQQDTSSTIIVKDFNENIEINDVLGIYDDYGTFYYWGVITKISDYNKQEDNKPLYLLKEITLSQFESLFDDDLLLLAQTSTNQKSFYNTKPVCNIIDFYLSAREFGFKSIKNTMQTGLTPVFSDFIDRDVKAMYKGINHSIVDNDQTFMPFPLEKEVINLKDFLYSSFTQYNRIIRPFMSKVSLPDPYIEVEYIESTGEQYINTGISPGTTENLNKLRIELDAQFTELSGTATYLLMSGYYNSTAGNRRNILIGGNETEFQMLNGAQVSNYRSMGKSDLDRHYFVIDQIRRSYLLRNYNYYGQTPTISNVLVNPILLFVGYNSGASGTPLFNYSKARIYGGKIYRDDVLIAKYIPCYNRINNEVGLYNTVNNTFLTNQGTGSFIKSNKLTSSALNIAIINPVGTINYDGENSWDYNKKVLFNTWEYIKNVDIVKEEIEYNTICIYSADASSLRGAYTILKNGDVQQISTDTSVEDRIGSGKTEYVFDGTNNIDNIIKSKLAEVQYNHKITFDIIFNDKYGFNDFHLGQHIDFYRDGEKFESLLTSRNYSIQENSDTITNATFTLGKVRTNLTSKININKIQTKKK